MDIAGLSMNLSQIRVAQEANVAVMKMAMDVAGGQMADLTDLMDASTVQTGQAVDPNLGRYLDVTV